MRWDIQKFEKIESTNSFLYTVANAGTVVVAKEQTAGRGRDGNVWNSPIGGLYFSILLSNSLSTSLYPLIAALSVRDALGEYNLDCSIKWPNDIIYQNKKVCGILCEKKGENIIVGIGVNTNNVIKDFPIDLQSRSITLCEKKLDNDVVLERILWHLGNRLLLPHPLEGFDQYCITTQVTLTDGTSGKVVGIDTDGALMVQFENNIQKIFSPLQIKN